MYMTNKVYLRNTLLLFAAMAVTKIVGAIFKIPLANILGGTGMGYFSTAYGIYSPVFAVTAAGIPTVLMRQISRNMANGRYKNALKIKRTALILFTAIGAAGMLIIWLLSSYFTGNIAASPESRPAVILIAPAVLFCCVASVYRGYYEGCFNVVPTSVANVTEAISRAIAGLAISYGIILYSKYCFVNGIDVFGQHYNTYNDAYQAVLPLAAAGAISAVTFSEICGLIALVLHDRKACKITVNTSEQQVDRMRSIASELFRDLIPLAAFALVMNCFSFIDLLTVTRSIDASIAENFDYYKRCFANVLDSGIRRDDLANFMYGSYSGIAMSLFMLIPSFAGMTEKTSIPEIATAWEKQDKELLASKTMMLFKMSFLIGCPACFGAAALAEPILTMLYPSRPEEISVCVQGFAILCIGGIFMITASAVSGFFQAIGKAHIPLWLMVGAVVIKAVLNPVLLTIPSINITGAPIATVCSYIAVSVAGIILVKRSTPTSHFSNELIRIILNAAACAFCAAWLYNNIADRLIQPIVTVISVIFGGFVYGLLLILTGVFRTSPIIKSEKQKKRQKGLEKSVEIG